MKHFFYKTLFLISILFSATFISAQENKQNYKLSHEMSADELLRKHEIGKSFVETLPPTGDVRNIAEWEPAEGVLITYDGSFGIPYTAIAEMSQNCIVTTIVSGLSEENQVRNLYIGD